MERAYKIIQLLLNEAEPVTMNRIAETFKLSNKTVRNDMKKVEAVLAGRGLTLEKKPGVGVKINGSEASRLDLMGEVGPQSGELSPYSAEARRNYILKRLFMAERNLTIKELSDELYVSKVTVQKDLSDIELWLEKFQLKLYKKTNYGIEVKGKEENWRNAVASLIAMNKENNALKELLYDEYSGRLDYRTVMKLREMINLDYAKLERVISNAEAKLRFRFSDEAFASLVIHVAIAIKRLRSGKDVRLPREFLGNLKRQDEFAVAESIATDIRHAFGIKLPEEEIGYILLHILGAKMQQEGSDGMEIDLADAYENEIAVVMAKEIIEIAQRTLAVSFENDRQLLNGLVLHLRPTVNRVKYGLTLKNPILNDIKENYPDIFGVAWMTSVVFEKYLGKKISEEEIGYIALHIGAAIERLKKPLKAIVVCPSGIGTSQLLAVKLEKHFREIEIKSVVSILDLKEGRFGDTDFVISTVPIDAGKPVVCISPLLTQNDIKKLDQFISDMNERRIAADKAIISLLDPDLIELNAGYEDKERLLMSLCHKLMEKNYVKEGYEADIMTREAIASTAVGSGVAIPHGLPQMVLKSKISIVILGKPVFWGDESVDIVLLVSLTEKDIAVSRKLFRSLYKKLYSETFLAMLRKAKDKEEVTRLMEGIYHAD